MCLEFIPANARKVIDHSCYIHLVFRPQTLDVSRAPPPPVTFHLIQRSSSRRWVEFGAALLLNIASILLLSRTDHYLIRRYCWTSRGWKLWRIWTTRSSLSPAVAWASHFHGASRDFANFILVADIADTSMDSNLQVSAHLIP